MSTTCDAIRPLSDFLMSASTHAVDGGSPSDGGPEPEGQLPVDVNADVDSIDERDDLDTVQPFTDTISSSVDDGAKAEPTLDIEHLESPQHLDLAPSYGRHFEDEIAVFVTAAVLLVIFGSWHFLL